MKISICMCTYNGELYIKEQLESLINQTKLPNEIIIYDDCSSDNTINIINEYAEKIKSISWIINVNEKNMGWKSNFAEAINKASGDYIFLCDQDDIWINNKVERMIEIISNREDIELLACNQIVKLEESGEIKKKFKNDGKIEKISKDKYLTWTARPGCVFCFKRNIIEEFNKVWKSKFPHDAILWKIAYLRETLYVYNYYGIIWRRHDKNATKKNKKIFSSNNIKIHYEVIKLYEKYFDAISETSNITNRNMKKLKNVKLMIQLRKDLYETKSTKAFFRLSKYIGYYATKKAYLLDALVLINKKIKNFGGNYYK